MTTNRRFATTALLALILAVAIALPTTCRAAEFLPLGHLAGAWIPSSGAASVADDGFAVAGGSNSALGGEAATWTANSEIRRLGDFPGAYVYNSANAISSDGATIVGFGNVSSDSGNLTLNAFKWSQQDGVIQLGDLQGGANESIATAVSAQGNIVVGVSSSASSDAGREAFRWTLAEGMVGLGDLPGGAFDSSALGISSDGRVIVGYGSSAAGQEAVVWNDNTSPVGLGDLPGGLFGSAASAVSADGKTVVGNARSENSMYAVEAFRWTESNGMVGLGDLPGGDFSSEALAVSGDGSIIVGESVTGFARPFSDAFIWDAEHGMRELRAVLDQEYGLATQLDGWRLISAADISADARTIVGTGVNPDGEMEGWIARLDATAVPEPSTIALLAAGIATAATATFAKRR